MRLGTISHLGTPTAVVLIDDEAYPLGESLESVVALGLDDALELGERAQEGRPLSWEAASLRLPYRPPSIRDFVTFESHVEGVRRSIDGSPGVPAAWYDAPTFYFTNPHALYGPDEPITRPRTSRALDFELEVACIVGADLRSASEAEAAQAIFGYTILNDWSARDLQAREMQVGLGPAKGKDFATSLGPWITTADELTSLNLECKAYVNEALVGHDALSQMHWSFPQMVSYASRDSLVRAGDLLASGTTGGGGCLAELWGRNGSQNPPPLEPGDVVRLEVDRLGALTTRIAVD